MKYTIRLFTCRSFATKGNHNSALSQQQGSQPREYLQNSHFVSWSLESSLEPQKHPRFQHAQTRIVRTAFQKLALSWVRTTGINYYRRAGGIDREFAGKLQGCAGGKPAREPAAVTVHRDPASVHCTILVLLPIAPRTIMLDRAFFGHIFGNRIVWMNVIRTIWVDQTISVDLIILER